MGTRGQLALALGVPWGVAALLYLMFGWGPWSGALLALVGYFMLSQRWNKSYTMVKDRIHRLAEGKGKERSKLPVWANSDWHHLDLALDDLYQKDQARLEVVEIESIRLTALLEGVSVGILVSGSDGRVQMANRAFADIFGASGDLIGRRTVEVARLNALDEGLRSVWEGGTAVNVEMVLQSDKEYHLDVHAAPIRLGEVCVGVVAVFHDITRLRQLERMRKDFVANVSHELRTPLTAIKGCAETLIDGALEDRDAASRFVQVISSHSDRLTRLLDELLDLARLESDRLEVQDTALPLRQLVESCTNAIDAVAGKRRITLAIDIPAELEVKGDRKLLENALINLLDNAVKYTPEGGSVQLRAVKAFVPGPATGACSRFMLSANADLDLAQRVNVEVADTGIGIPSQDLERVFERFFRVDKGRSREMGGTGLGLSIVRHIIEAHGEQLYVESELGKGSVFGFTLPLSQD